MTLYYHCSGTGLTMVDNKILTVMTKVIANFLPSSYDAHDRVSSREDGSRQEKAVAQIESEPSPESHRPSFHSFFSATNC